MNKVKYTIIVLLFCAANVYIIHRLLALTPAIPIIRVSIILALVVVLSPFIATIFYGASMPSKIVEKLYKIGTSWIFILLYICLIMILIDIIKIFKIADINMLFTGSYTAMVILIICLFTIFFIGHKNYYKKKQVDLDIKTDKILDRNFKIVFISDMHLGYGTGNEELNDWIEIINGQKPDIILIGGDLMDNQMRPVIEKNMDVTLRKLKSEYGVFMALGNHEYFGNIDKRLNFLEKSNITVLRDSAILVDNNFYIVGREDASRVYRNSLSNILEKLDNTKPIITIDHQPIGFQEACNSNVDLLLSGHTHRGQVFPVNLLLKAIFKYSYGFHKKNNTNFYITSGIGIWGGKFRIGTRSEFVVINLHH